jgi:hypothetical protein
MARNTPVAENHAPDRPRDKRLGAAAGGYYAVTTLAFDGRPTVTVRRLIVAVGAVLLLAGIIGLLVPVSVSDSSGNSVSCGNAIAMDLSGARSANDKNGANIPILNQVLPHTDYVAQCQSSVNGRRSWSIPLAVIGVLAVGGALLVRRPAGSRAV